MDEHSLGELKEQIEKIEYDLLQQEHRPLRALYNVWYHWNNQSLKPAACWAVAGIVFSPAAAAAGVTLLGIAGIWLAFHANSLIGDQNRLIGSQSTLLRDQNRLVTRQNEFFREQVILQQSQQASELAVRRDTLRTRLIESLYTVESNSPPNTDQQDDEDNLVFHTVNSLGNARESYRIRQEALVSFVDLERSQMLGSDDESSVVNVRYALLDHIEAVEVDLSNIDFTGADLRAADLRKANFANANLTFATLRGASA